MTAPAIDLQATINVEGINRGLARVPSVMAAELVDGFEHGLLGFRKDFFANPGVKGNTRGRGLLNKKRWPVRVTGGNSFTGSALNDIQGTIGTKAEPAGILTKGGVVRGRGKMLALPLSGALTRDGRKKKGYGSPAEARAAGKKFIEIRRGNKVILYELTAKRGRVKKPTFLLISQVTIPALLRFYAQWETPAARAAFIRRVNSNIDRGLRKIFGADAVK